MSALEPLARRIALIQRHLGCLSGNGEEELLFSSFNGRPELADAPQSGPSPHQTLPEALRTLLTAFHPQGPTAKREKNRSDDKHEYRVSRTTLGNLRFR